jgi:hypothetical protein
MEPYFESGYINMYKKRNKTYVAYIAKNVKTIKTSASHNYQPGVRMKVLFLQIV